MNARLYAYVSYVDARSVLAWLEAVGFTLVRLQESSGGEVMHAEVRMGDAVVMVSSADADYIRPPLVGRSTGAGLYLRVDDVDGFHQRAVAAGGQSVVAPEDTDWGTKRARVLDPGGLEWSVGTYQPGEDW